MIRQLGGHRVSFKHREVLHDGTFLVIHLHLISLTMSVILDEGSHENPKRQEFPPMSRERMSNAALLRPSELVLYVRFES